MAEIRHRGEKPFAQVVVRGIPSCEFRVFFDADGEAANIELRRIAGGHLNATELHDAPWRDIVMTARDYLAPFHDQFVGETVLVTGREPDWARWGAALRERPGRRGHSDAHLRDLARVAEAYVAVVETERAPLQILTKNLGLKYERVRNIVNECRNEGLLTQTKAGRKGGRLTAKARRILEGDEQHGSR